MVPAFSHQKSRQTSHPLEQPAGFGHEDWGFNVQASTGKVRPSIDVPEAIPLLRLDGILQFGPDLIDTISCD